MTTFQIPEGKVVDRIELDAGEGKATIDIIYKEDRPKRNKPVAVLCETDKSTCLYRSRDTGKIVMFRPDITPDPANYVPVRSAKPGEFVVLPKNDVMAKLTALDAALWQLSDSVPLKAMTQEQKQLNKQVYDCFTDLSELISYSGSK